MLDCVLVSPPLSAWDDGPSLRNRMVRAATARISFVLLGFLFMTYLFSLLTCVSSLRSEQLRRNLPGALLCSSSSTFSAISLAISISLTISFSFVSLLICGFIRFFLHDRPPVGSDRRKPVRSPAGWVFLEAELSQTGCFSAGPAPHRPHRLMRKWQSKTETCLNF